MFNNLKNIINLLLILALVVTISVFGYVWFVRDRIVNGWGDEDFGYSNSELIIPANNSNIIETNVILTYDATILNFEETEDKYFLQIAEQGDIENFIDIYVNKNLPEDGFYFDEINQLPINNASELVQFFEPGVIAEMNISYDISTPSDFFLSRFIFYGESIQR